MGFKPDVNDQLVSFSALTLFVWSSGRKNRPRNDLLCVELDVTLYKLTHSYTVSGKKVTSAMTNLQLLSVLDKWTKDLDDGDKLTLSIQTLRKHSIRCRIGD